MKKIILTSVAVAGFMLLTVPAHAVDSTGCGLGSVIFKGQKGPLMQILAVTTNSSFGTQTFGITSGTMGCDPNGTVTGGTGKLVFAFLENNMEQYAFDASRGSGETIDALAGIMGVSSEQVARVSKEHFNELFPDENVQVLAVATNLMNLLNVAA